MKNDFNLFARDQGISSQKLHDFQSSMTPYILEERTLNVTQMDVFSRLMKDRTIFLGTGIDDHIANIIIAQLLYLENVDNEQDIKMIINSPGGGVYAGLGIYDTMNLVQPDVEVICTGIAASMGAILLANGQKGKRHILKHSRVMIHQPLGGAQGQASDMEITVREIQKLKKELYETLVENTGQKMKKIEEDSDRDYWMTSNEALKYGIVDTIISKK